MKQRGLVLLLFALMLLLGCDSGSIPVAPEDTVLTVQANPTRITVTGTSTITVILLHTSGRAVLGGTEVRLSTTMGTIEELAYTDDKGIAYATLKADGREGKAVVTARSGITGTDPPMPIHDTVDVDIGFSAAAPVDALFEAVTNDSLRVFFDDQSTGEPTSWHWSFGDGASSTEREPTHEYPAAGSYTVTLTVQDADSEDSVSKNVRVPAAQGEAPVAAFTHVEVDDRTVIFTGSSTGGTATLWEWDFGDGGRSTLQSPSHRYSGTGVFNVVLNVSNSAGSSTKSEAIEVYGPLEADFGFTTNGLTAFFTDASRGKPTARVWDFGDGTATVTDTNPTHPYTAARTYTVTLTVTRTQTSTGTSTSVVRKDVTVE